MAMYDSEMNFFKYFGMAIAITILSLSSAMAGGGPKYGGASGGGGGGYVSRDLPELIYIGDEDINPILSCPSGNVFDCSECRQVMTPAGEINQTEMTKICASLDGYLR